MIARDIRVEPRGTDWVLGASVESETPNRQRFRLEFVVERGQKDWISDRGDAFLAVLVLLAMVRREDLAIEAPVSPRLLERISTIMDIYCAWCRDASRIRVAAPISVPAPGAATSGLFFSCGVDSFYSMIKNAEETLESKRERVSRLVIVHGFDIKLANAALFEKLLAAARRVADEARRELLVVRTNLRSFSDPIVSWDLYHGGPLAGVGFALGPLFSRCLIGSTHSYDELVPWGSHPLLDPLWSTEGMDFIHDGAEAPRTGKIRRLSGSHLAMSALRVCWNNEETDYNCGRCEKCLRTMIALHIAGALDRCRTFAEPLSPAAVRRIRLVTGESSVRFMEDLLRSLGSSPVDQRLAAALRHVIRISRWRTRLGSTVRRYLGPNVNLQMINERISRMRPGGAA